MRLYICDSSVGFTDDVAQLEAGASITGKFKTNQGRTLLFFGVQLEGRPVTQLANFNSFAIAIAG